MKRKAIRSSFILLVAIMVFAMMPVTASAAAKAPAKVKISSVKVGSVSTATNKTTVTIKWKKAARATGYVIYAKQGDGKWVKQKKVGKSYRSLKLKNVPAGQVSFRIRAVNKKKYGKYSAIKTKYISSPLTVQQYIDRVEPSSKNMKIYDGKVSFSGGQMIVSYDVEEIFSDSSVDWNNLDDDQKAVLRTSLIEDAHAKEMAEKFRNYFNLNCGIKNFRYTARFVYQGTTLASVSY